MASPPDDPASNEIDLGSNDGVLTVAEIDVNVAENWRIWGGLWRYGADFERLRGPGRDDDNQGAYVGAEWRGELDGRQISGFLHYGIANDDINPLKAYMGAGIVLNAAIPGRPDDQLGIAIGRAVSGNPYQQQLINEGVCAARSEVNVEKTYRAVINDWLVFQPNVQIIEHPSATRAIEDAWVVGLRFELAWGLAG